MKVMATSREGLRVGAEHLWAVPVAGRERRGGLGGGGVVRGAGPGGSGRVLAG